MKSRFIYSKIARNLIRIIAIVSIPFLILFGILSIIYLKPKPLLPQISFIVLTFASTIFCTFAIIFPEKLEFFALMSFGYSVLHILFRPFDVMSFAWHEFFISALILRGFFLRRTKLKIITLMIFYLAIFLTNIRLGFEPFFKLCIYYSVSVLIFTLVRICNFQFLERKISESTKELNLAEFADTNLIPNGLVLRDAEWLQEILKGKRYKEIASEAGIKEQTVKNRLSKIYKILEVGDRQGFLNVYKGYKIIFDKSKFHFRKSK